MASHGLGGSGGAFGGGGASSNNSNSSSHRDDSYFATDPWRFRQGATPETSPSSIGQHQRRSSKHEVAGIVFTFLSFGVLSGFLGATGSYVVDMNLSYSRVFTMNRLLVREVEVDKTEWSLGPVLYSFSSVPALNESKSWSVTFSDGLSANTHHEWALWMNAGSNMQVSYHVEGPLVFAVLKGEEAFTEWVSNPEENVAVEERVLDGSGKTQFYARKDGDYYFAFGNKGDKAISVKLQLNATMRTHSVDGYLDKCQFESNACKVKLPLSHALHVLLIAPSEPQEGLDMWRVKISPRKRWLIPGLVIGFWVAAISAVLAVSMNKRRHAISSNEESPLVKDNVSTTDECCVCLDAKKSAFFDPCGHSATCFPCGLRIMESDSKCVICRQRVKGVRKLYDS